MVYNWSEWPELNPPKTKGSSQRMIKVLSKILIKPRDHIGRQKRFFQTHSFLKFKNIKYKEKWILKKILIMKILPMKNHQTFIRC